MVSRAQNPSSINANPRQEGRLPPGQSPSRRFPVQHYGLLPVFQPAAWLFRIWGAVDKPAALTWDQIWEIPRRRLTLDIHCVTRWSRLDTDWEGITVASLLEAAQVRPLPEAAFVMQHAEYGFTVNLPLHVLLAENFLLATHYRGRRLTPEHGCPLRGVVGSIPGRRDLPTPYLRKGAKWLRGLEFMSRDRPGFWERAGYHNEADVWKEQRFA